MSIVSVDNIQPIGSGTSVTVNKSVTLESGSTNITGVCTATSFSGSGANLTSLPAANLTGTLPAISGANLTSLPSQVSISNNANDRIFTGGGGTNLIGESGLTFNGNTLNISGSSDDGRLSIVGHEGYGARLSLIADQGDDHIDQWNIRSVASNNTLTIDQFGGGTFNTRLTIASDANNGNVTVNTGNLIIGTSGKGIDFHNYGSGATISNNLLDDYEEGSWTPEVRIETRPASDSPIDSVQGNYIKVGGLVHAFGQFTLNGTPSERSTSRAIEIRNFPFTHNHNFDKVGGDVRSSGHLINSTYGSDIYFVMRMLNGLNYCRLEIIEQGYAGTRNASPVMTDNMNVIFAFTFSAA